MVISRFQGRNISLIGGFLVFLIFILFVDIDPGRPQLTYTAGVAILMAIWWVTEALPIGITALLPIVLFPLFGVMNSTDVVGAYINPIIFLYIGGFMMALAMEKWNLHRRIALFIMLKVGQKPFQILLGFMLSGYFLSMWMSNTATTMLMVPICISILKNLEEFYEKEVIQKFGIAIFLGTAYSCSIGGMSTLIGTPPNLSLVRIYDISFPEAPEISFATWMIFALPLSALILSAAFTVLYILYVPFRKMQNISRMVLEEKYAELGKMSKEEKYVGILFIIMALLWIFRAPITIGAFTIPGWSGLFAEPSFFNDGMIAVAIATLLFIIPGGKRDRLMDWKTAVRIPWDIVLLFGGGFALALVVKESGLGLWMGQAVTESADWSPLGLMAVLTSGMSLLTEFTSNAATTEMVLPIIAGISQTADIPPLLLMIPVTLAASLAFILPIATPPNAIVFGSSPIRIKDMALAGVFLNFISVILVIAAMYLWGISVFGI